MLIDDVRSGGYICPKCGGYFRMSAYERIKRVADEGTFLEWDRNLVGTDPLQFEGYEAKLAATRLRTHMKEAVITGRCRIGGRQTVLCVMDGRFFMASMGGSRRRKNHKSGRTCHEVKITCYYICMLRRLQECRRDTIPDADGKNECCH